MAAFPYRAVRGLGALQIFLSVVAFSLGIGDLVVGWSSLWGVPSIVSSTGFYYIGSRFRIFYIGTAVWTGLFFLVAGSLAASIGEGRTAERKIGAILTMSLLNTIVFAPGLIGVSIASFAQSSYDLARSGFGGFAIMFAQEITLTVVGFLEWILSVVTVTVCSRSNAYDQRTVNQVVPMSTKTTDKSAHRPSYGHDTERPGPSLNTDGPSTSTLPGLPNELSEKMVTNLAPEIGIRHVRKPSSANVDEEC
ncbi:Hypp4864 [Branchiostoma lanceolatum]|uniref:Hypp4864 protein n=1 Tax=Branchiostoma lanceolatum TaxID=7740 RepID=A0A8K0AGZ4_BRALA|nr:Hypp4864 [Branchiostoma lanceolatum]